MNTKLRNSILGLVPVFCVALPIQALGQGQDSTAGERWLRVMAEMLPGIYDNANQAYFDRRRQLDAGDRHARVNTTITRVDAPAFGPQAFLWINTVSEGEATSTSHRIATLEAGQDDTVIMRHFFRMQGPIEVQELAQLQPEDLRRTDGCDYVFKRRAGGFRGHQGAGICRFQWDGREVQTANTIELSKRDLLFVDHKFDVASGERITGVDNGEPYWLERARVFHCYADLPGVGGGRDEPFERYEGFTLHDKGGSHWFTTRDDPAREIGLVLQSVTWQVLNENNGNFNRNSLVVYTLERLPDGSTRDHGYAFTEPEAERIGVNLKWMLVNCSMTPRDQARPEL